MKRYTVYFELFGKKMKYVAFAKSREDAMDEVRSKISFNKIEVIDENKDVKEVLDSLGDFINKYTVK